MSTISVEAAKKAFAEYDVDGDGQISLEEYINGCRANSNIEKTDNLIKMFRLFDTNKDGALELSEFIESTKFLGITKDCVELDVMEVREAFLSYDVNKDGKITLQEYIDGCKTKGSKATTSQLTSAFRLFDLDHDGEVNFEEFNWAVHYLAATVYDHDPNINSNINF